MDVSIIMINYNTYELTKNALESIFRYTNDISYEVILIDNNSPDGSGEKLKSEYAEKIKFIQNSENLGTSKAFNKGLKDSTGKYVLWINTDILLFDNFIKKLFDYMEENPDCGICGGNLLDAEGKPSHSNRREMMSLKTLKNDMIITKKVFKKIFKKRFSDGYNYTNKAMEVGIILGADMFVRKSIFDEIGGLDEDIFMYCEETEFAYRVKTQTKYKIVSVPWAKMIHLEGKSFDGKFNARRHRFGTIGTTIFIRKSYGEKDAKNYLDLLLKSYRKFYFISKIFFMKDKKDMYKTKIATVKSLMLDYPNLSFF